MEEFDYKKNLSIDESALDKEWLKQSEYYDEVGEALADAKLTYDNLRIRLEKVKGKAALDMRTNPKDYGIKIKVTNDVIESKLATVKEVYKLAKRVNDARYVVNRLSTAEIAFQHRKSSLTKLTELYLSGYYSEMRATMPRGQTQDFARESSDRKTVKQMKKRRK